VKCSEGLSNRVSNIIIRYIDHMTFAVYRAFSFITFFPCSSDSTLYQCIYGCMFCMHVFDCVNCVL
jgi:hypothetical protein